MSARRRVEFIKMQASLIFNLFITIYFNNIIKYVQSARLTPKMMKYD